LSGFPETDTDLAFFIADDDDGGEAETASALHDFRAAVNVDDLVFEFGIFVAVVLTFKCHLDSFSVDLEFQTTFTSAVGESLDASVIEVTATIENDRVDVFRLGFFREEDAYGLRSFGSTRRLRAQTFVEGRSRNQSHAFHVIHQLRVHIRIRAKDRETGLGSRAFNFRADPALTLEPDLLFITRRTTDFSRHNSPS